VAVDRGIDSFVND